jgi:superoxide dismutase, Fe-Mn family
MAALMHRRGLLGFAAAATATLAVPGLVRAQAPAAPTGPHRLPDLPYGFDANEAAIDARTMEIHWRFHHGAQVTNLNTTLRDHGQLQALALDELIAKMSEVPEAIRTAVRNNGGGHANHTMFWSIMGGKGGEPTGELAQAIARDFGDLATFKTRFAAAANGVFGSGWAFVTVDRDGRLAITTRPGQDNPLMDGQRVLMGNDVWEHAYYLRYQNRRPEYSANWWNVLDWTRIGERFAAAKAGTLRV